MVKSSFQHEKKSFDFPKLMINKGGSFIVLFFAAESGVVVTSSELYNPGEHSKAWDMDEFKDFVGTVTLSNEG